MQLIQHSKVHLIVHHHVLIVTQCDALLFPIHKPQHWSLLVSYYLCIHHIHVLFISLSVIYGIFTIPRLVQIVHVKTHTIHCIDSLCYSDENALNWIL